MRNRPGDRSRARRYRSTAGYPNRASRAGRCGSNPLETARYCLLDACDPGESVRGSRGPRAGRPARARAARPAGPARRQRSRRQLRRHPPGRGRLPGPAEGAVRPGCRGRGPRPRGSPRRGVARQRRVRRAGARAPGDHLRAARLGRRHHRAGPGAAGHHGVAPAAHQRPAGSRRDGRRARGRRRRGLPGRPARPRDGGRPGHRLGVVGREAGPGPASSGPTSPSTPGPRPATRPTCATP